jgi:anti-sigma factor RsiW
MTPEKFEYLLSQYLDGELSPAKRAIVEKKLADDPQAWEMLREFAQIDAQLRGAMPLPEIDWEANAARISSAIAELPEPPASIPLFRPWIFATALAACLLLGITLLLDLRGLGPLRNSPPPQAAPTADEIARADVTGPDIQSAAGDSVADVALDSPPVDMQTTIEYSDPVVAQPSSVSIVSALDQADQSTHWEPK